MILVETNEFDKKTSFFKLQLKLCAKLIIFLNSPLICIQTVKFCKTRLYNTDLGSIIAKYDILTTYSLLISSITNTGYYILNKLNALQSSNLD